MMYDMNLNCQRVLFCQYYYFNLKSFSIEYGYRALVTAWN